MPFKPRYSRLRVRRKDGSSYTLKTAWKKRNRRAKGGLVARTAQANRKQIRDINRKIETKVIQSVGCTVANAYGGQYIRPTAVDTQGEAIGDPGTPPLIVRPFYGMGNGDLQSQRTGSFVNMKNLTYKIQWDAAVGIASRVGCLIVLDRNPTPVGGANAPSLNGVAGADGTILTGPASRQYLRYQDLDNCSGPNCRFKVLKHLKGLVSSSTVDSGSSAPTLCWSGTLKGKYKVRYDAAAGSVEPTNQSLLFCFYSDSTLLATCPTVQMYSRFRFKDA